MLDLVEAPVPDAMSEPDRLGVSVMRLDLTRFRNYAEARIDCDSRPVVLTGPNGAGKTNLLEAVSFLAPGRGLRRARLVEIDHRTDLMAEASIPDGLIPGPWAVAVRLATPAGQVTVGTGRETSANKASDRRVVRIDGQLAKGQASLARYVNLVWLTPQMDRLFQEGAPARRRFLDRLVFGFDPEHATRLAAYEQALKERAGLLRDGNADPSWLAILEETMVREGIAVAIARRDITHRLDEAAKDAGHNSVFPVPALALSGVIETWLAEMDTTSATERLKTSLVSARRVDAESGVTSVGAHRIDLTIRHAGKNVAAPDCSTGEQKALLIAIILAHAQLQTVLRGVAPILLLDEVAAHLDRIRRRALFDRLVELGSQAWLTGTDPELFDEFGARARFFHVADGAVVSRH